MAKKKTILEKYNLKEINKTKNVKLRARKKGAVINLYLDFWNGQRHLLHYFGLSVQDTFQSFIQDENTMRKAILIQEKYDKQVDPDNKEMFRFVRENEKILFNKYFKRIAETKTGSTKEGYLNTLRHLENYKHKPTLKAVNDSFFNGFTEYLQQQELSQNTIWLYTSKIKTVLRLAVKKKILKTLNITETTKKKESKREFLTLEEIKLFQAVKIPNCEETKQAFLFSCFTGLRFSDILKLKFSDIQENYVVFQQQKTKDFERLPLSETALKIIEQQRQFYKTKNVFHISNKKTAGRHIKKLIEQAGIQKHITFHCSRHTFATLNLTMGNDIYSVSKLLGHKDFKTTQIYAKLVDEKLKSAVNKLPVL